jgi:hypothetical protein
MNSSYSFPPNRVQNQNFTTAHLHPVAFLPYPIPPIHILALVSQHHQPSSYQPNTKLKKSTALLRSLNAVAPSLPVSFTTGSILTEPPLST